MLSGTKIYLRAFYKAFISPTKAQTSYSQYAEDIIIYNIFKSFNLKNKGIYVDVGSNHPRRGSNSYFFYKRGWRGLLIDLEYDKFLAAKWSRPRDTAVLEAVSAKREKVDIMTQQTFSTNTTIKKDAVDQSFRKIASIYTKPLQEILIDNRIPKNFELLSIDVEGSDLDVLLGIDFSCYRPKVVCVENWEVSKGITAVCNSEIHLFLVNNKYQLSAWSGFSTIYSRARTNVEGTK